ncbi:DUF3303 family protein [Mesorhizobium sp. BR1-1-6]|nr:DUF3303 family protein [Mesorhizobium sp. BR1-1-6]
MLFLVTEDFRGCDRKEIYRRFRDYGRLKPRSFWCTIAGSRRT